MMMIIIIIAMSTKFIKSNGAKEEQMQCMISTHNSHRTDANNGQGKLQRFIYAN